jgi:superfamily II DNA or RNA helicase
MWYFPIGLVSIVKDVLNTYSVDYNVVDESGYTLPENPIFTWNNPIDRETGKPIVLRDYQLRGIEAIKESVATGGGGGIIACPTGSGKSLMICKLIEEFQQPTLIVVGSKELLHQWRKVLLETLGFEPAIIGDSIKEKFRPITVAMLQTLVRAIDNGNLDLSGFNLIAVDEVHKIPARTAYKVAMHCPGHIRIGASATPHRQDGADMKMWASVGSIVCDVTAKELISAGVLAKPVFRFLRPENANISSNDWPDVRLRGIVANDSRNRMIVQQAAALVRDGHRVYINVGVLEHGEILSAMLNRANVGNYFLHGTHSTKLRKNAFKDFESGLKPVLVSTLLKEGVDLPFIDAFINAAGGKSEISQIQRVGRALRRKHNGKNEAVIVDFIDGGHRHLFKHWQERYQTYCKFYDDVPYPG